MLNDTIAAIATASGVGSIAIVRVSGAAALPIALKISKKERLTPRYATLTNLYDDEQFIDEAILLYFQEPRSFTTEDVVEFQVHGGYIVAKILLDVVLKNGARLANPGEFSKRAFLGGRLDAAKAESIAKLIEAKSLDAHKVLTRQIKGDLSLFVDEARDALIGIMANIEVSIDYAEEDLPKELSRTINSKLSALLDHLKGIYTNSLLREGMVEGYRLAIVGKPNVGKSSLLNKILMYERAIVSDEEGTTRDTIEENVKIGSHILKIVDTAGIRETANSIERIGIERSKKAIEESDVVLAIFDASRKLERPDFEILDILKKYQKSKKILTLLNKIDISEQIEMSQFENFDLVRMSFKRDSIVPLLERVEHILDQNSDYDGILLVSQRQIEAVKCTMLSLSEAIKSFESGDFEIASYAIQVAIKSISSITKPFENDEMFDKMFGEFCLGK